MSFSILESSNSIIDPFIKSMKIFSDSNALWVNKIYYSYSELYQQSVLIAKWLQQFDSQRVLVFSGRTVVAYKAIIASGLSGKAYVPLNPSMPLQRNKMMADLADTNLIIADVDVITQVKEFINCQETTRYHLLLMGRNIDECELFKHDNVVIYTQLSLDDDDFIPTPSTDSNDDACLLFTSGSTGVPKGVMLSHKNILSYLDHTIYRYKLNAEDRVTQMTELTFDFSVQDMFMSWAVGACVYAFPEGYFIGLPKYLNENKITFMTTVPSTARLLYDLGKLQKNSLPYLRQNIFGGEPFSDSIATLWQEAAPNTIIDNVCGPTEATIAYLSYTWNKDIAKLKAQRDCIPLGKPFPHQKIKIIDENFQPILSNQIGELCLCGSQVIKAYWKNIELSQDKFIELPNEFGEIETWYRTGDVVLWDEEDGVIFKGRIDDQIQIRGCRVEKLEIERVIRDVAGSESVAVIPWPIAEDGTVSGVIAFISGGASLTTNIIYKRCRKLLPDYMSPKEIHLLDALPLNFNGKTDYLKLKQIRSTMSNGSNEDFS